MSTKKSVSVNTPAENSAVAQLLAAYAVDETKERRYKNLRKAAFRFILNKKDADEELLKIKEEQKAETARLKQALVDLQEAEARAAATIRERFAHSTEIRAVKARLASNNTEFVAFMIGLRTAEDADIAWAKAEAIKPFIEVATEAKAKLGYLAQEYNMILPIFREESAKADACFCKAEQFK